MVIVPKDKPAVENLNSYYLNVPRLLEHYQGELGSGAIHFKSSSAEGVILFDKEEFVDGVCEHKEEKMTGRAAIDFLMTSSGETNYVISIYRIDPERVYYWSSIPAARRIYQDLSAEFTDLEGLMRKMGTEKLTGYIEASIGMGMENALIFYNHGQIIGNFYSWDQGGLEASKVKLNLLVEKTKKSGGTFHVSRISIAEGRKGAKAKKREEGPSTEILTAMEELLALFERIHSPGKADRSEFNTLLKRRFLELAETYHFLDPFRAEFQYSNRKINFTGKASDEDLMKGILTAVIGMADNLGLATEFDTKSAAWFQKYDKKLKEFGIAHYPRLSR
jgi:hypothetical protein